MIRLTDSESPTEVIIAQTAYCLRVRGDYGSEPKAVAAMRKRIGAKVIDREAANRSLTEGLTLFERTEALIAERLRLAGRSDVSCLSVEEDASGTEYITADLLSEFPTNSLSVDCMLAMLWCMPRNR